MSSTGATLSGSYSGATSVPSAAGFKYGTTSGNLSQTASTTTDLTATNGNLAATLTGLSAGTTYYYKAFATVSGTGDYSSQSSTIYGSEQSFVTNKVATASVTTGSASSITASSAALGGSFSGASGEIYETGFYWGTTSNPATELVGSGSNATSGNFSLTLSGLSANTTYYYKAFVREYNENSGQYEERLGSVVSFKTSAQQQNLPAALSDYGMPDVSGLAPTLRETGSNDRDDNWYSYSTNNNKRQIAVHTYSSGAPNNAETVNYVVLYDENKYAPVWTAHTMNKTNWPDNNVGRNDSWIDDPAISLTQQGGLDNANSVGYSRGHFVASDYRQTTVKQNKQTFYHSNQAPQFQNGFNSGVWSTLEGAVKSNAPSGTTMLYVVTGVLYESSAYSTYSIPTSYPSGTLTVPIPSHFYKCIMKCEFSGSTITNAQGIAFIYTNRSHSDCTYYLTHAASGSVPKESFVTSINSIEQRAGFDFFAAVPDNLEDTAEANTDHTWFTSEN